MAFELQKCKVCGDQIKKHSEPYLFYDEKQWIAHARCLSACPKCNCIIEVQGEIELIGGTLSVKKQNCTLHEDSGYPGGYRVEHRECPSPRLRSQK